MRIVSTTLAGPGAESIVADALRSARGIADEHVLILSGCDADATLRAAGGAVDGLTVEEFEWTGSYADARNFALRFAESLGADWQLTLDSDERLEIARDELPLLVPEVHSIHVKDRDHGYQKERLIRCGVGAQWQYPVHERLITSGRYIMAPGSFWELEKTEQTKNARRDRGIEACLALVARGEADAHIKRHLAECLGAARRMEEATAIWLDVASDESAKLYERTWCEYRLAEQQMSGGDFRGARDRAAIAVGRDPGLIQELGTLIACCSSFIGDQKAALFWALTVVGAPVDETRGGHRFYRPCIEDCRRIAAELAQATSTPVSRLSAAALGGGRMVKEERVGIH